jgi:RNA polymerase sigma-70 factor (ECF subfamily)
MEIAAMCAHFAQDRLMNFESEFLRLFFQHQADLRAFIGSLVRSRPDFDDVFQETTLTLWEKFREYDPKLSFGAWARGVATNKILQWRDRKGRTPTPFSPQAIQAISDAFDRGQVLGSHTSDALDHCLQSLPAESRQLLTWWYAEEWSIERIAQHIGRATAATYKTLARLRQRLLECIQRRLAGAEAQK